MNKFFVFIILFLGVVVVAFSFSELETILVTLEKARFLFFILALSIQTLWFVVSGRMYQSIFHMLGVHETVLTLGRISAAANFINVVAPTAGVGGVALFAAEAKRRGHPAGKATVAGALMLLLDTVAFLVVLSLGLVVLVRRNDLDAGEITASLILFSTAIIFSFVLYMGYRSAEKLGSLLAKFVRAVNAVVHLVRKENYLSEDRAHEFANEIAEGFSGLTEKPIHLIRPVLWGIVNKSLWMLVLVCSFLAFEVPFSAGTIIAGFAIGYLFLIVSPTPSGIGIVEGILPVALTSLNVNWSQAVVITLFYRAITFWYPLGMGAWAFRTLHAHREQPA